jgi:hypothetical protein
MKPIVTPKGSGFLLCQLSQSDARFPKYPPQPVTSCTGHEREDDEARPAPRQ